MLKKATDIIVNQKNKNVNNGWNIGALVVE